MNLSSVNAADFAEPIQIIIEGQTYAVPAEAADAYAAIIERLMTELPDFYRTRQNTETVVYSKIERENLQDAGLDADEFALFWSHVMSYYPRESPSTDN